MWRRVGPKLLVAAGVLQGVLPQVNAQLDVLGRAGVGGWLPVVALVGLGLVWELRRGRESTADSPVVDDGRVRQALLESVRAQWVSGVLDRSLEAVARVQVGLSPRPTRRRRWCRRSGRCPAASPGWWCAGGG